MAAEFTGLDMSDPKYLSDLRKYGSGDPTQDDLQSLEAELYEGPDRAMAVVMGSLVERSLGKLLRNHMREDEVEELFKPSGVLGDFSSKIEMSYALKLVGRVTRHDLNIIRLLRNQFAHSRRPIQFTTDVVKRCCNELSYPDMPSVFIPFDYLNKVTEARLAEASDKTHPRTRFMVTCNEIAQRIYFIRSGDISDKRNDLP
ncbi:hypothetical protein [Methylocystis iwaonis]|uniref:Mannitol operon repressor n=1 Tax=Methylocystis iwaonis TaxID=2885079 RepID=A0ABM8E5Y3_9HYPH|nr:hypothetical protein [Methylocystis iwaonis]BDV33360.1 hypothetical protein SS37A_08890 [Methylocystis iwaonis]